MLYVSACCLPSRRGGLLRYPDRGRSWRVGRRDAARMTISRRPKSRESREYAPGPSSTIAVATTPTSDALRGPWQGCRDRRDPRTASATPPTAATAAPQGREEPDDQRQPAVIASNPPISGPTLASATPARYRPPPTAAMTPTDDSQEQETDAGPASGKGREQPLHCVCLVCAFGRVRGRLPTARGSRIPETWRFRVPLSR